MIRVNLLFEMLYHQNKFKTLVGQSVFQRFFQTLGPERRSITERIKYRVLRGEVVGRMLHHGTGETDAKKAHKDPAMCQHPSASMEPRANRTHKWWTCLECTGRWGRLPMDEIEPQGAAVNHLDLVTFQIRRTRRCTKRIRAIADGWWRAAHGDASQQLSRLAQYIHLKQVSESYEADETYAMPSGMDEDL